MKKPKIEVFTTDDCSYCDMVKAYLKEHNIQFEEKSLSDTNNKNRLRELKPDAKTVPQIFVNSVSIGGAREATDFFKRYF